MDNKQTNKQYITTPVQYSTVQYSTTQYSPLQYSIVQYSTIQYSTVQYTQPRCLFQRSIPMSHWQIVLSLDGRFPHVSI